MHLIEPLYQALDHILLETVDTYHRSNAPSKGSHTFGDGKSIIDLLHSARDHILMKTVNASHRSIVPRKGSHGEGLCI